MTLLPDVESACSIQDIPLDSTIAGSFAHSCYIYLDDYDVWRVNAHAGLTYTATASTPATADALDAGLTHPPERWVAAGSSYRVDSREDGILESRRQAAGA